MIRAASLPIEVNLFRFIQFLKSQSIGHRINEESGQQVIWVEGEQQATLVREALANWPFDEDSSYDVPATYNLQSLFSPVALIGKLNRAFLRAPVSFSLILACILVSSISLLGAQPQRVAILFYPMLDASDLLPLFASIDSPVKILRSLSPMLLHFGELHLVFNMMWLWYFGRQLESAQPRWLIIILILLFSFAGNTAQYLTSGYNNFGGMSGVIYGLVGYTWIVHTLMPRSNLHINNKMFVAFVIALVAMKVFASSWVANAAHLGGVVAGLLAGMAVVGHYRFVLGRDSIGR